MIKAITQETIWHGRTGDDPTWFHPRACTIPSEDGSIAIMTLQKVTGNDVFHHVHWTRSDDFGKSWREPVVIPALGRRLLPDSNEEGICDVSPDFHPASGRLLAMGHNVYYRDDVLTKPAEERWPVYVTGTVDGTWSDARKLEWDDPRGTAIYTSNCSQRLMLPDGDVLLPLTFGPLGRKDRGVGSLLCSFNGKTLAVKAATRDELRNEAGRGLLEPSMTVYGGRYYMTIRAEDGHGYVAVSNDGIEWDQMQPWQWDNDEPLTMSTTQQHWLAHKSGLYLVYTRKAEENVNVMRWRAPLYIAKVDTERMRLIRDTERVVIPMVGDGINDPSNVPRMGNFHITTVSDDETWVTVGECLPVNDWCGDTILARIQWS